MIRILTIFILYGTVWGSFQASDSTTNSNLTTRADKNKRDSKDSREDLADTPNRWRDDGKCGKDHPLPDGSPAECDPDSKQPCCDDSWTVSGCGNTTKHCLCVGCTDYREVKKWREKGQLKTRWRFDKQCGPSHPLPDGSPSECNPDGDSPCCSWYDECTDPTVAVGCTDYRLVREIRRGTSSCRKIKVDGFLKDACFNETSKQLYYKCTNSDVTYTVASTNVNSPGFTNVSAICKNDPHFYQACGRDRNLTNSELLCGGYICHNNDEMAYIKCDKNCGEAMRKLKCYAISKIQDKDITRKKSRNRCNDKCEMEHCRDEYYCNGVKYGKLCYHDEDYYFHPMAICSVSPKELFKGYRASTSLFSGSRSVNTYNESNYEKCKGMVRLPSKESCTVTNNTSQKSCIHYLNFIKHGMWQMVPIFDQYIRCSLFDISQEIYPYCLDYLDQTNCSDVKRVGGYCQIKGFNSSVSKSMLCYDEKSEVLLKLCDDDFQNNCFSPFNSHANCRIHKHLICNGKWDCLFGSDESRELCELLSGNFTCERRFNIGKQNQIPISWLMDDEIDCLDGQDENEDIWDYCPYENKAIKQVKLGDDRCEPQLFICPGHNKRLYIKSNRLCDGMESCGNGMENTVCRIARDFPTIEKSTFYQHSNAVLDLCSPLTKLSMDIKCHITEFKRPWGKIFGEPKIEVFAPTSSVDCSGVFGENYLFLSCMNLCKQIDANCPLDKNQVMYNSCPGQYPDRIITLANNSFLTFITENPDKSHHHLHHNFYQCKNGRCVEYEQVCDLIDDCGDMSDELGCKNQMICADTLALEKYQFIAHSQRCDGIYDCFDLSDECNETCGKEILGHWALKVLCWFMGVLAILFNAFTIVSGLSHIKECTSGSLLTTISLVSLIGAGDFLIGVYLVILSIYDSIIYKDGYCEKQTEWLTGTACLVLGVVSTVGSQVSLFAMTALSVIRVYGITCRPMTPPSSLNKKSVSKTVLVVTGVVAASLSVAVIPLVPHLEDYFVQGMYYDPEYKVFIGFPNKERHIKVLKAYEQNTTADVTDSSTTKMSWKDIGLKVDAMFIKQYDTLKRRTVHFYGNDGVCLFKYFVRSDDAKRSRQTSDHDNGSDTTDYQGDVVVWFMLTVNFVCFIVITASYLVIVIMTRLSSKKSGQLLNPERMKEQKAIQFKILIIITTDFFCWIPFILISALHNLNIIDATLWYVPFAMTVLPLNSVINPVVYDESLRQFAFDNGEQFVSLARSSLRSASRAVISRMSMRNTETQSDEVEMGPSKPLKHDADAHPNYTSIGQDN